MLTIRATILVATLSMTAAAQKLQVYVLAGQSNMQGHAKVTTFDHIGADPATAPLLAEMRAKDGSPKTCDRVWISYMTGGRGGNGEVRGKLTAGYGARRNPEKSDGKIGPEFTFGITVAKSTTAPVLLIKTAWGGKSLHTDFRSPSAGAYEFSSEQLQRLERSKKDVEKIKLDKRTATGRYYRHMIDHVREVLGNLEKVCPAYDAKSGYELAGFVWFQGWNDMVDRGTYPSRDQPGGYDRYSECLAHFIRDVRKDLKAPGLPFVIGVMGVGGPIAEKDRKKRRVHANFRAAMAKPASLPEFSGTVTAVETAPFWDMQLDAIGNKLGKVRRMARMLRTKNKRHANRDGNMTRAQQREYLAKYRKEVVTDEEDAIYRRGASNAAYHYLGCAKTMAQIGVAFAKAIQTMHNSR